jgi:hypothetical protein
MCGVEWIGAGWIGAGWIRAERIRAGWIRVGWIVGRFRVVWVGRVCANGWQAVRERVLCVETIGCAWLTTECKKGRRVGQCAAVGLYQAGECVREALTPS